MGPEISAFGFLYQRSRDAKDKLLCEADIGLGHLFPIFAEGGMRALYRCLSAIFVCREEIFAQLPIAVSLR